MGMKLKSLCTTVGAFIRPRSPEIFCPQGIGIPVQLYPDTFYPKAEKERIQQLGLSTDCIPKHLSCSTIDKRVA
jgi:hypothetical protein